MVPNYVRAEMDRRIAYASACYDEVVIRLGHEPLMTNRVRYIAAMIQSMPPLTWTSSSGTFPDSDTDLQ